MYVTRGIEWGGGGGEAPKCLQMLTGGYGYHASCVSTHLHYLFSCFCFMLSCFVCRNLTFPSFKKGAFVRNCYFSPMRSISVVMKLAFFNFKFLLETKVSQSAVAVS